MHTTIPRLSGLLLLLTAALTPLGCQWSDAPAPSAGTASAPELLPFEMPDLSGLPSPAPQQISDQLAAIEKLGDDAPEGESGAAWGRLAELCHAYELVEPARTAYENAARLEPGNPRWPYLAAVVDQTEGRLAEAQTNLARALELQPGDPPSLLRRAEIHMTLGEPEKAGPLFAQVRAAQPDSAAALFGTGRVAEAAGDLSSAAEVYERALELQPEAKNLHSLLASLYRRLGDREAAERHLAGFGGGTVTFPDPLYEQVRSRRQGLGALLDLALEASGVGDNELAIQRYLAALEIDPVNANALSGIAGVLRKTDQPDRAASFLERLVAADPSHRVARLELATMRLETGEVDAAIAGLKALAKDEPDFDKAHLNLGVALGHAERWREAADSFRRALELVPRDQTARFQLAVALTNLGSEDAALATLERTVKEAPSFVRARQHLASLLEKRGRLEEASVHYLAVAQLNDAPPQERALASYQLGRLASLGGDEPEAIRHFENSLALFPELWQAHLALGRRYSKAGDFRRAAERYGAAATINPQHVAARQAEAEALIAAGEFAAARRRLEQGLGQSPNAAELGHSLARLLAAAPDDSVRDGRRALEIASSLAQALPRPEHVEAVAMALAELGRFEEAIAHQQPLIDAARAQNRGEDLRRLESHLSAYRQGRPARLAPAP